jgi:hypothetical protein
MLAHDSLATRIDAMAHRTGSLKLEFAGSDELHLLSATGFCGHQKTQKGQSQEKVCARVSKHTVVLISREFPWRAQVPT